MKTRLTLKAGLKGTEKLVNRYGDSLVCVRYRYDEKKKKRFKTIELIIDEIDWEPGDKSVTTALPHNNKNETAATYDERGKTKNSDMIAERTVGVRVNLHEKELQTKVKGAGGIWNRNMGLWIIREIMVKELGLENRIIRVISD